MSEKLIVKGNVNAKKNRGKYFKYINEVQSLLNEKKYTMKQISKIIEERYNIKYSVSAIQNAITHKYLVRPKYAVRKKGINNKSFVKLNLQGELMKKYGNLREAESVIEKIYRGAISKACKGEYFTKKHEYKGYLWFYEDEYLEILKNNNKEAFILSERKDKKIPIVQLSLAGELIKSYESQRSAQDKSKKIYKGAISKACKGEYFTKKHEYKGYLWFYEDEYLNILTKNNNKFKL